MMEDVLGVFWRSQDLMEGLVDVIWSSEVWLPPNVTWDSLKEHERGFGDGEKEGSDFAYAAFRDLLYPLPLALLLMVLRSFLMSVIFRPLGIKLGLKDKKRIPPTPNRYLEEAYRRGENFPLSADGLSKRSGFSLTELRRWYKQRRQMEVPSSLQKFCETGWRWSFYSFIFCYGVCVLWGKEWVWDLSHCYQGYPYHPVHREVWLYYMLELAFYYSLTIIHLTDPVRRKDFWEMLLHHCITITLLSLSWTAQFVRIGTLVLIIHDSADHLLELAKMIKYCKYQKACDVVFVMFFITWVTTRCFVFPLWILRSTLVDAFTYVGTFPLLYIFNAMLCGLQVLSLIWTYLIIKAILKAFSKGGMEDTRSDSEDSGEEEEDYDQNNFDNNNKKEK